jgi:hypothetical protein
LEAAGAGVMVDGEHVLGFAWSDDLMMLVEEEKLDQVLRCLEDISGLYKKKTNDTKVFVTPLCPKPRGKDRPVLTLGDKILKYKSDEKILGFTLSQGIQGGTSFIKRIKDKATIAAARIEKIGSGNGRLVRPDITTKYYKSLFLPVLTANLTLPQLDRPSGDRPGYVVARQATADVLRRMLSTSALTDPVDLIAEAGWDLPDLQIILSKLRLMERLLRREQETCDSDARSKASGNRRDAPSLVLRQRIKDVANGEDKGLCAEVKRIWSEADMAHKWPPPLDQVGTYASDILDMERAAERISISRMKEAIRERSARRPDSPYYNLWDGTQWRLTNGSRRQVGLMTTARLGALIMNDSKIMRQAGADPSCPCCGRGYDNLQHALLSCPHQHMQDNRVLVEQSLISVLSPSQLDELSSYGQHDKKMFLLGHQMRQTLSIDQQLALDLAVKVALESIDDFRTEKLGLNPMCGRTYTRPPEHSMQQAALWDRLWKEDCQGQADWLPGEDRNEIREPDEWNLEWPISPADAGEGSDH